MRNIVGCQFHEIAVDQTRIAAADADALDAAEGRGTHDRAYCCIHAGGVAAGCQNSDPFYCVFHRSTSFLENLK